MLSAVLRSSNHSILEAMMLQSVFFIFSINIRQKKNEKKVAKHSSSQELTKILTWYKLVGRQSKKKNQYQSLKWNCCLVRSLKSRQKNRAQDQFHWPSIFSYHKRLLTLENQLIEPDSVCIACSFSEMEVTMVLEKKILIRFAQDLIRFLKSDSILPFGSYSEVSWRAWPANATFF